MIKPLFEEWGETYKEKALLVKVDVDANAEAAQAAGIQAMPTFKFFKGGNEVHMIHPRIVPGLFFLSVARRLWMSSIFLEGSSYCAVLTQFLPSS